MLFLKIPRFTIFFYDWFDWDNKINDKIENNVLIDKAHRYEICLYSLYIFLHTKSAMPLKIGHNNWLNCAQNIHSCTQAFHDYIYENKIISLQFTMLYTICVHSYSKLNTLLHCRIIKK